MAKARVILAESPERAFAYYARGASSLSSDEDVEAALATLSSLKPLAIKDSDDVVAAAFAAANAVAHLCVDIRGQNDQSARSIVRELDLWRDEAPNDRGDATKAEGLAAKADTSKKFGALLHKLVAKYPAMIRKVADPQQEYWEKIMKEGIDKKATDEVVDGVDEDEDVEDLDAADEL